MSMHDSTDIFRLNINDLTNEAKEEMLSRKGCCYNCLVMPICSYGCDNFIEEFKKLFSTLPAPMFTFKTTHEEI